MRLLLVSTEFPPGPGGIGSHAYEIARNLHRLGWDITVLSKQEDAGEDEIREFNRSQPFRIVTVRPQLLKTFKLIHWLHKISQTLRKWKPDVIMASGISAVLVSAVVAKFRRDSLIVVAHGEFPSGWQLPWLRWSFRQAKALICVSNYTRHRMSSVAVEPEITTVIPNGGDHGLFKPLPEKEVDDFRQSLGLGNSWILLTVGKVSERKGQDLVIRALPQILKKLPNTHYFIVGLPTRKAEFANLADQLGVSEFVHFTGAVDPFKLVLFLNACDVFTMLSRHTGKQYEAYGIAVVEAALCGKPAVVSANSGVVESIIPGKTGLAVPESDEIAAAEAILTLLQDEQLRKQFGQAARTVALETSTWERRAVSYDELLRKVAQVT